MRPHFTLSDTMKKRSVILLTLSALTLYACVAAGRPPASVPIGDTIYRDYGVEVSYLYSEGMKRALIDHDRQTALDFFRAAIGKDSLHAPSYYEIAGLLADTLPETALAYSMQANRLDSTSIWYRGQLGRLQLLTRQYNKALATYRRLTTDEPHNPLNYRTLAALYEQNGQPFSAISILDSAEYKLGRIEELSAYKRQLLIDVRLYDKAIAEALALAAEYPYQDDNYRILAELYATTGKDSSAMAYYRRALEIDSSNIMTIASLGQFYRQQGDIPHFLSQQKQLFLSGSLPVSEKLRLFRQMTQDVRFYREHFFPINELISILAVQYPGDKEVFQAYVGHLLASGNMDQALVLLKTHLSDSLASPDVFYTILDIETFRKNLDSVGKYTALALHAYPDNADLHVRRGAAMTYLEQYGEAKRSYLRGLRLSGSDSARSVIEGYVGDLYHQQGRPRKGYSYYRKALLHNPDNAAVLNNYAYFLSLQGRGLDSALRMSRRANLIEPGNATYLDTEGWVLYRLGRYEEARKILSQAIALDRTESAELLVHYGDVLFRLGEEFMAGVYWKKAERAGYDPKEIALRLQRIER